MRLLLAMWLVAAVAARRGEAVEAPMVRLAPDDAGPLSFAQERLWLEQQAAPDSPRLNVPVALRDAKNDPVHRQALQEGGGRVKVPCLRIEEAGKVTWMYESKAIIAYLDERFASA